MPTATQAKDELLNFLVTQGIIDGAKREDLLKHAQREGIAVEELLVSEKIVEEEALTKAKAKFFGLPYVDLTAVKLETVILKIIPKAVAENYHVLAFDRDAAELKVAMLDPRNFQAMAALDVLSSEAELRIRYYLTSKSSFSFGFKKYQELKGEVAEVLKVAEKELAPKKEELEAGKSVEEVIKGAPVSRIVSVIMRHAFEGHASDIHIEPFHNETRVRYRVDGVMKTSLALPENLHSSIVARVKVLAGLKLDETRIPQDGRITETFGDKLVDFRVSILPLQEGKEKAVLRILKSERAPTLSELGFHPKHIEIVDQNIKKPHGLILISGPTGAGKSTTLYAILSMLNQEGSNIVTLEDPVEYAISGVNQSQIHAEIGYTFAGGLRAILRQDPNIIMVGEIRDSETAELSIHAALTGHLLLSTIHTNDAIGVVPRLIDLKVEPFLLGATFNLAIAQRLARKVCQDCKEVATLPDGLVKKMREVFQRTPALYLAVGGVDFLQNFVFYHGKGCQKCGGTGYRGRVAVTELVQGTPNMQRLIAEGFPTDKVNEELKQQGMITMEQDALLKALAGLTTVEEVLRIRNE